MKTSRLALGLICCLGCAPALAEGGGNAPAEGINYIPVTPPLVVNFGGPSPGRTRYIKAELSIRTENGEDAAEVIHHLPLIRDKLISLISAQTEEEISSPDGKEKLREQALVEINKAIHLVEFGQQEPAAPEHGKAGEKHPNAEPKHAEKDDPKAKGDKAEKGEAEHEGPASDLFFNNFVVQK